MLIQSLRPQTFSQVVGNKLNNKILMTLAKDPTKGPSTLILQGSFGSGKALDIESLIPTPDGIKRAGDIQIGDYLFDRHGKPTEVIGVFPQGFLDSYKVTFEDGRTVYCNSEHIWSIINEQTGDLESKTLQEIKDIIDSSHDTIFIPVADPIELEEKEYEIPPYALAIFLIKSLVEKTTITVPTQYLRYLEGTIDKVYWNILTNKTRIFPVNSNNELYTPEVLYGELYTDIVENCIIPDIYLTGSIEQRWELLQGIMDCCGTISNDNNVFCTIKTKDLKDSILRLTYSLGLVVTVMGDEDGEDYGLLFKTNNDLIKRLFKNSRFLHKPLPPYNNSIDVTRMAITSIEKEEEQREMVCFMVNNPEHLFLCNDYIVTHNTTSSRLFAKALNCKHLKENDICGECDVCKADLDNVPWYTEFDSSAINVDTIRDMRDIFMTTAKGYNKVVTIDEVHLLSKTAQSALLKLFEETPEGLYFILATTDPDKLLPTIRSRSLELIYTAKSSKEVKDDINKHAIELGLSLSQSTLDVIATRSRGIMRNAHMLLDKVNLIGEEEFLKSDIPTTSLLNNFITAILKTDRILVLDTVSELSRIPVAYLKDDWQEYFLNLMKASVDPDLVQDERIKKLATALGKQTVNIVKFCIQDWIIKSFQNSTQAQTAMLAIYQSLSKEQK